MVSRAFGGFQGTSSYVKRIDVLLMLQELNHNLQKLKMDDFSHNICLVKREDISNVRSNPYVTPIMDHIRLRIAIRIQNLNALQQIEYYRAFARTPSRGAAGPMFEAFCQWHF